MGLSRVVYAGRLDFVHCLEIWMLDLKQVDAIGGRRRDCVVLEARVVLKERWNGDMLVKDQVFEALVPASVPWRVDR